MNLKRLSWAYGLNRGTCGEALMTATYVILKSHPLDPLKIKRVFVPVDLRTGEAIMTAPFAILK